MAMMFAAVPLLTADPAPPPQTTPIIDTDKTMAGSPWSCRPRR